MKLASIRLGCFALCLGGIAGAQSSRPNIIFLMTDDHRWNALGAMGNGIIRTPELDSLSRMGATFENAYATTPICFSSRASFFSGKHQSRHGIKNFGTGFSAAALAETYPMMLRKAGYKTGFIGKWGLGGTLPSGGFDQWYGFEGQGHYEIKEGSQVVGHLTAKMGDQAENFLGTTPKGTPFCLSVSFKAPHAQDGDPRQFIPDPDDMGLYAGTVFGPPPNADPAFFQSLPAFLRDSSTELRKRWNLRYRTPAMYQESMRNYYRLLTGVDKVVGRIRKKLAEIGAAENTVIVFTSDHGMFLGDRGYADKWLAYEASIRIPLIIHDPRLPASRRGLRFREMALNIDVPSTLLSLAGIAPPAGMQGGDLMSLVRGTARQWRLEYFHEHDYSPQSIPASQALVGSRYKYIVYPTVNPDHEELYDLASDPDESRNLIGEARYRTVLDSLKARFQVLKTSVANDDVVKEIKGLVQAPTGLSGSGAAPGHRLPLRSWSGPGYRLPDGARVDGLGRTLEYQ